MGFYIRLIAKIIKCLLIKLIRSNFEDSRIKTDDIKYIVCVCVCVDSLNIYNGIITH